MRGRGWLLPTSLALLLPGVLAAWTITAVFAADTPSPAPTASGSAPPGNPQRGAQVFGSAGCASCHGASLEGGIGPKLNPIVKLHGVSNPLSPQYLASTIRNGRSGDPGYTVPMPAHPPSTLSDQDLANLVAYIIAQNKQGTAALGPVELSRSDVFWVTTAIVLMVLATWLLARYNIRWIARRAEARRKR